MDKLGVCYLGNHVGVDAEQVGIYQSSPVFWHWVPLL